MKRRFISAISKLTLGVLLFTATGVYAATGNPSDKAAEVKYVGTSEDAVVFSVTVDNPTGTKFNVQIFDEDGTQIFSEIYSDKKFDKKFKLAKSDKHKLTFVIKNFKDVNVKQSFEINTRYVEDVVVNKL